jgi:hypothetical protein
MLPVNKISINPIMPMSPRNVRNPKIVFRLIYINCILSYFNRKVKGIMEKEGII